MTPATEARQLSTIIFGLTLTQLNAAHLDLNDYRLLLDLLGRQVELDARFLAALHSGGPLNEADLADETEDILAAAQAVEVLRFEKKEKKYSMKTDFLNKMLPGASENKTVMLRGKVDALRKRHEATESRLRDARQLIAEAVRALRQAEDDMIVGEITQGELDRARKAAADAITAIGPLELELANDQGLLTRAGELLKAQIEKDQAEAARERLAEHALFRRELSTALPGLLALIERGMGIEARMKAECPKALNDLAKRRAADSVNCFSPQNALHPLTTWLEGLAATHPEDVSEAAAGLLEQIEAAEATQRMAAYEHGARLRAQEDNGWAHRSIMARDIISRQ